MAEGDESGRYRAVLIERTTYARKSCSDPSAPKSGAPIIPAGSQTIIYVRFTCGNSALVQPWRSPAAHARLLPLIRSLPWKTEMESRRAMPMSVMS